jgi:hypothetical protein
MAVDMVAGMGVAAIVAEGMLAVAAGCPLVILEVFTTVEAISVAGEAWAG